MTCVWHWGAFLTRFATVRLVTTGGPTLVVFCFAGTGSSVVTVSGYAITLPSGYSYNLPVNKPVMCPLEALLAQLEGQTDHGLHGIDSVISGVVEVARRDVQLREHSLEAGWLAGLDSMLIHISSVDNLQDVLGLSHVICKCLEEFDVRGRVVEDENDRTLARLGLVLLGDKASRVLDNALNELLEIALLDKLSCAAATLSKYSNWVKGIMSIYPKSNLSAFPSTCTLLVAQEFSLIRKW